MKTAVYDNLIPVPVDYDIQLIRFIIRHQKIHYLGRSQYSLAYIYPNRD